MVLTDEEKRQSLMKKTQDNRVEKNKADTDDLNNIEILLKTIKKLENSCHHTLFVHIADHLLEFVFMPRAPSANVGSIQIYCGSDPSKL